MNRSKDSGGVLVDMTSVDVKHWMTTYHSVLSTLKLHELKIPSTMHSGVFESEAPWDSQIEAGVRALDLRICQLEVGQWVFHYNNQPSANSVQSLIEWCNAYYSAPDMAVINEILILNIHDCYSLSGAFDYAQLKNLFVNGLHATGLIPRGAALLTLGRIHHDYWGKNIILSWNECVEDDLIWPCRWQGWINTAVPAGVNLKVKMQVYVIHNAVTELSSTWFVANASSPSLACLPSGAGSALDHVLIEKCINTNLEAAPYLASELEQSGYNYLSEKMYLIIKPDIRNLLYQIAGPWGGFMTYPHTSTDGYHTIEFSLASNQAVNLTIRALDARGKVSGNTVLYVNTTAPAPVLELGHPSASDMPDIESVYRQRIFDVITLFIIWNIHSASVFDHLEVKVFRLQKEGMDTGPAVFEKTVSNTSGAVTFAPVTSGDTYVAVVMGVYPGNSESRPAWRII